VAVKADGTVIQTNHYYPFGTAFAENTVAGQTAIKYNGKELDAMHGLSWYDYSARHKDDWRFTTVDPLAEKYYSISPYAYCGNNPLKYIDPTGMDWYRDSDSTCQYHRALNAENKDAFIAFMALRNGKTNISYVGATFQTADANYRSDGSNVFG
jgi:RHS repeat-associated protein